MKRISIGSMLYDKEGNELAQVVGHALDVDDVLAYNVYWFNEAKTTVESNMFVKMIRANYIAMNRKNQKNKKVQDA
jgi:hypothetical protein